jgi:hypothetical protein
VASTPTSGWCHRWGTPTAFVDVAEAWLAPSVSFADWAAQVARRYGDWIEWFRSARVSYLTATGALLL